MCSISERNNKLMNNSNDVIEPILEPIMESTQSLQELKPQEDDVDIKPTQLKLETESEPLQQETIQSPPEPVHVEEKSITSETQPENVEEKKEAIEPSPEPVYVEETQPENVEKDKETIQLPPEPEPEPIEEKPSETIPETIEPLPENPQEPESQHPTHPSLTSGKCAVMIEPRKHKAIKWVVHNFAKNLPEEWHIQVFHGTTNEDYVRRECRDLIDSGRVSLVNTGHANLKSKPGTYCEYSRYMLKRKFWEKVVGEHVLIFQTDSCLFKRSPHKIDHFLRHNCDYIGAPWAWANGLVGCGGLSLRKKSSSLYLIDNHKFNPDIGEDLVFSRYFRAHKNFKCAGTKLALKFCVGSMFYEHPFGMHKCWAGMNQEQMQRLANINPEAWRLFELNNINVPRPTAPPPRSKQILLPGMATRRKVRRPVQTTQKRSAAKPVRKHPRPQVRSRKK
jgi:chemotaxis protein histidine kinase CheA